jgi:hypothetical protein
VAGLPTTYTGLVWRRFRRHPGAVGRMIVFSLIVLSVLLAGLSPYDPIASNMAERPSHHSCSIRWAQTPGQGFRPGALWGRVSWQLD